MQMSKNVNNDVSKDPPIEAWLETEFPCTFNIAWEWELFRSNRTEDSASHVVADNVTDTEYW